MDVLSAQFIYTGTAFETQEEVFRFAAEQLCEAGRADDAEELVKGFFSREEEFSTYIENGISLPHCRCLGVKETTIVVVKNAKPVKWNEDGDLSDLMVLLAVSQQNASETHLKILARLAQSLMDGAFVERLRALDDPVQICDALASINQTEG